MSDVANPLEHQDVYDETGATVALRSLWQTGPIVLAFVRHFGLLFCQQQVAQLHHESSTFENYGSRLIVVGNGKPWFIKGFREKASYDGEVYTDPTLSSFRAMKLRRTLRSTMVLGAVRSAYAAYRQGFRQTGVHGDAWQQGGVFVVAPSGELPFSYASEHAGDHPPVHAIVEALRAIAEK